MRQRKREKLIEVVKGEPVDARAAMVTSKGVRYRSPKKILVVESDMPIATRNIKKVRGLRVDLTGRDVGRLKVLGISRDFPGRWVCRCSCGRYVLRNARAITNEQNNDRCEACRHYAYQRRKDEFQRLGLNRRSGWDD